MAIVLMPPTKDEGRFTTHPTTVFTLPLPAGNFVVNAIVPIQFLTPHGQVTCQYQFVNGSADGGTKLATAIGSSPTPGGSVFGFQTLPLTDSVTINAGGGSVSVVCTLAPTTGQIPAATVQPGASMTADQKSSLVFEPQP
ncbi:hypothetical protein KTT_43410 [Tengunoibacter tsumagoiensis]|uniref:Uncharacterized protein n=2 Tax=Tengunoibacter tsumagoiensis TaxID=2014871 RepID=A0A402A5U8_9CHLR|nr:hypothetical protein KTT_43410 [Tengunoibacter tsumagoiensis]